MSHSAARSETCDSATLLPVTKTHRFMKRLFDFCGALVLLIVLSPLLLGLALAVRVKLGSPVLFRQRRPGLGGRIFTVV